MTPQTTEIDGHRYECTPFGFDDSVDIGLRIVSILGGPVGEAFDAATKTVKNVNADALLESNIDLGAVGKALSNVPRGILEQGGPAFVRRILARTKRGYRDAAGKEIMMSLSETHVLDAAYAGNLGEMMRAVMFVLRANYGPLPGGASVSLPGLLSSLSGWLGALGGSPVEKTSSPVAAVS